jgi:hypothetical protein
MIVMLDEYQTLQANGAADDTRIQVIRTFERDGITFSDRCRNCRRWIWCGQSESEGKCVCGSTFRITFDLAEQHRWQQDMSMACMDCGKPARPRLWEGARQPWHVINGHQVQCDPCHTAAKQRTA